MYTDLLTNEHLKSLLNIGTSKISPQLQTIVGGKSQLHTSQHFICHVCYKVCVVHYLQCIKC